MAMRFLHDPGAFGTGYPIIGANSSIFKVGDAVTIDANGFLAVPAVSSKIHGFILEDITMASDNQTVAKVCPKFVNAELVEMVVGGDSACTQTKVGEYADLVTVTLGAQVLNGTVIAAGQFLVLGFDPAGDGTTTDYVVKVAEPQFLGFAQA
jgi:hypothetical protein